jgi:arylsulfatase A-like enzyme
VYWGSHQENPGHITSDLLSLEETTLAERLRERDYLTVSWVQNSHLRDFMGFGQGFVDYNDQQGSIARIHRRAFPFFRGSGRAYPFFAYLHYIDLHDPYRPPAPYDTLFGSCNTVYEGVDLRNFGAYLKAIRQGERELSDEEVDELRACYDGLIRLVDDEIGRLFETLKRAGLYDDMLIVLTSDHGDAFMEHGFISHSTTPYEELVRIPLIVKLPGGEHGGRVVDTQVRSVDILPTVLSLVGSARDRAKGFPGIDGCSLQPLLAGGELEERCSTAVSEIAEEGSEPTVAVRTLRHKVIRFAGGDEAFYDLERDPDERQPLSGPEVDDPSLETLRRIAQLVVDSRNREATDKIALDEQQIRELKALGYLVE